MNRKLGLVVFSNHSGLGNQSLRLAQMLKPEKIMHVDFSKLSKNKQQHPEWYDGFTGITVQGFPSNKACDVFLSGLTHLFVLENPLNWHLIKRAKQMGIKTYVHCNYEFCDNLKYTNLPIPDKFVMPSTWMNQEMRDKFGNDHVIYLPPPLDPRSFKEARDTNLARTGKQVKFLHIVGTLAAEDRNGTLDLLEALKHTDVQFSLVIKSQHPLPTEYMTNDSRVSYKFESTEDVQDLYKGFDAMILPRRFGGLCLPMNEALMAALPVIMPDIKPNNDVLPSAWMVKAKATKVLQTRTAIDVYAVKPIDLALKIEEVCEWNFEIEKTKAFEYAYDLYRPAYLIDAYNKLW